MDVDQGCSGAGSLFSIGDCGNCGRVVVSLCLSDSNENFVFAFAFSHHGTLPSSKPHDRVWKAVREHKPWWWALLGSLTLVVYGFLPTLQPTDSFGRVYAVYGGFFIFLSYIWGMIFDNRASQGPWAAKNAPLMSP